jgi:hypothetical protein
MQILKRKNCLSPEMQAGIVSQKLQISNHFLDDLKRLSDLFAA